VCGIAGALDRSGAPIPIAQLRRTSDVIAHRESGSEDQCVDGAVGLADIKVLDGLGALPAEVPA
jgi:hypothetical protein